MYRLFQTKINIVYNLIQEGGRATNIQATDGFLKMLSYLIAHTYIQIS